MISKNPRHKVAVRLYMTLAGEVCEVAETQATYMTAEFINSLN